MQGPPGHGGAPGADGDNGEKGQKGEKGGQGNEGLVGLPVRIMLGCSAHAYSLLASFDRDMTGLMVDLVVQVDLVLEDTKDLVELLVMLAQM